jgi:hypothetical protein
MKVWKQIASASQLHIPEPEFDRISPALDSLEKSFRPLVDSIPFQLGLAVTYSAPQENER